MKENRFTILLVKQATENSTQNLIPRVLSGLRQGCNRAKSSYTKPMHRGFFYTLFLVCLTAFANTERPNIIVIYTDDQGYGDVSALNPESKFETPNLDRLAREGMIFTDAHSSDTVCTPSRYGLLTGRYSWRTELKRGVFGAERPCLIPDDRLTLASLLRKQGYRTGMVGKWHLGMDFPNERANRDWTQPVTDMPLDKGFDYFYGIPASLNYGVLAWFEGRFAKVPPTQYTQKKPNQIAFSDYRIKPPYDTNTRNLSPANPKTGQIKGQLEIAPDFVDSECLTRFTDKAIDWIRDQKPDTTEAPPFFLYLAYTSPHKPVIPLEQFRGQGQAGAYGEFVIETDWHIGRLLKTLDEQGIKDNTLIVFTSDNGPETTWKQRKKTFQHSSAHIYREGKRSIYEGGHRVPFLVRWPAQVKAATTWDKPVCQTDLIATLADLLDVPLPADAGEDSHSFLPALLSKPQSEKRPPLIHHGISGRFAIRSGDWKLVMEAKKASRELYNLKDDPSETLDLLTEQPEKAKQLLFDLNRIIRDGRSTPGAAATNDTPLWVDLTWMK